MSRNMRSFAVMTVWVLLVVWVYQQSQAAAWVLVAVGIAATFGWTYLQRKRDGV